jgi:sugar lactone lactonase YvrE
LTCIANAAVTLVVGQSRASDFTLIEHRGKVQVIAVKATPAAGPSNVVKTAADGSATVKVRNATVDIGKNTTVRHYDRIVNYAGTIDEHYEGDPDIVLGELSRPAPTAWQKVKDAMLKGIVKTGEKVMHYVANHQGQILQARESIESIMACVFVPIDTNAYDLCSGNTIILVHEGEVYYHDRRQYGKTETAISTYNELIIPAGTELTVRVQRYGNSSVTLLEGSALVVNLASGQVRLVNASQRLDTTISYSAKPPFSNGQSASLVLGQTGFTTNTAATTQSGLRQPSAMSFDAAGNLWVVDANNNRVLKLNPPSADGMSASLVIGQSSFSAGSNATSQKGLWFPLDIAFDASGNLWIVDAGNSRILRFSPPFTNGMSANLVIGQSSFTTNVVATTQSGLRGPEGMAFDPAGNLWIADRGNNRILGFSPPFSNGMNAALVIGQSSFSSGASATSQNGLFNPCCVAFDPSGNLWEAEWGNNRVMKFTPPFSNGMKATLVIGQSSFTTSRPAITQDGLGGPRHITFDASGDLWVADFGGNRVLEFAPPFSNGMNAISVIGKTGFTTNTAATTQTGMNGAHGVAFDSSGNLWTAEWYNNRILEFQATKPVSSQSRISSTTLDSIPQWWESKLSYPITVDAKQFMVNMRTNSTVSNLSFSRQGRSISLTVNGVSGTKGYVNMTWPKDLLDGTFVVTVDGKQVPFILKENATNYSLYASYGHSQRTITIMALAQPAPPPQPVPDPAPIQPVAPPAEPALQPQTKEVTKEVPKEVVKEVIKELPKEVIEEVPVVARPADTINPLIYAAIGTVVFLGVVGGILLSRRNKAISTKITCSSCGRQNAVGAQFCKSCGNSIWKEFKAYG